MAWDGTPVTSVTGNTAFATFIAQVRRELEESSAVVWSDASLLAWANEGMADYAKRTSILHDWQSGSTSAGQASYSLAANTYTVDEFIVGTGKMERISPEDYYERHSAAPGTGSPAFYAVIGGYAHLYPKPGVVQTYRYHRYYMPSAYTSATTTTTLPFSSDHDQAIRNYVKARAYEQERDFESAAAYNTLYIDEADKTATEIRYHERGDSVLMPATGW